MTRTPCIEWPFSPVVHAAEEGQVEHEHPDVAGTRVVDGVLQPIEVGHAGVVQHHNLTIEPGAVQAELGEGDFVLVASEGQFGGRQVAFYDLRWPNDT